MKNPVITKSEIIELLVEKHSQLAQRDVEFAVKTVLDRLVSAFESGERIEIRGFGSFSLHHRSSRIGRNPKTGESVEVQDKFVPHFKPGKELKKRVDNIS